MLGDLRSTGVRDLIVFCQDYRCSHHVKLAADYVDRWPGDIRISQLEPRFVCTTCGMRGSIWSPAVTAPKKPSCRDPQLRTHSNSQASGGILSATGSLSTRPAWTGRSRRASIKPFKRGVFRWMIRAA